MVLRITRSCVTTLYYSYHIGYVLFHEIKKWNLWAIRDNSDFLHMGTRVSKRAVSTIVSPGSLFHLSALMCRAKCEFYFLNRQYKESGLPVSKIHLTSLQGAPALRAAISYWQTSLHIDSLSHKNEKRHAHTNQAMTTFFFFLLITSALSFHFVDFFLSQTLEIREILSFCSLHLKGSGIHQSSVWSYLQHDAVRASRTTYSRAPHPLSS